MGLKFLQLFADMRSDHFEPLTDEELGIIIRAAMDYAFDGAVPDFPSRSVLDLTWRRMKRYIDQCAGKVENLRENGSKGGTEKANRSKAKQTVAKDSKAKQAVANDGIKYDHDHNHDQDHNHNHNQEHKEEEEVYAPAPAADENVIAFDGSDLAEDIRRNNVADDMIADYNLPRDRVTRSALLEDIEAHGEDRMREVLTRACQSNTRDRVTVNFWRAILSGKGRDSPKGNGGGYGEVLRQREYSPDYWKSIEVDLDTA